MDVYNEIALEYNKLLREVEHHKEYDYQIDENGEEILTKTKVINGCEKEITQFARIVEEYSNLRKTPAKKLIQFLNLCWK